MFTIAPPFCPSPSFQSNPFVFTTPTGRIDSSTHSRRPFAPTTPSPLRTSRNVQNLTPAFPKYFSKAFWSSPMSDHDENSTTDQDSPLPAPVAGNDAQSIPPATAAPIATTRQASIFSTKARSQFPQTLLLRATASQASTRRSNFLDRNRRSRDDRRFEARNPSEQAMRMEFVRERREWEERMMRSAARNAGGSIADIVDEDDNIKMEKDWEVGGALAPPDEEEFPQWEEWIGEEGQDSYSENPQASSAADQEQEHWNNGRGQHQHEERHQAQQSRSYRSDASDDEDYDQLFMDVLSQGSEGEMQWSGRSLEQGLGEARKEDDIDMS